MKKYKIPRNVKSRISFMGLDLIGWLLFLPSFALVFLIGYFIPVLKAKVIFIAVFSYLFHWAFQRDEKTGEMNIGDLIEYLLWIRSEKQIEPVWSDEYKHERYTTLQITVSKKRK